MLTTTSLGLHKIEKEKSGKEPWGATGFLFSKRKAIAFPFFFFYLRIADESHTIVEAPSGPPDRQDKATSESSIFHKWSL